MAEAAAIAAPPPTLERPASYRPPLEWQRDPAPVDYPHALHVMQQRVAAIRAGTAPELVWLLQHPPLYTAGTSAAAQHLLAPTRFPTYHAGRGGQWTYHGPGQVVAYVMLDLAQRHGAFPARDIRGFVAALEEWLIRTAAAFGVRAERRAGRVGIWVTDPRTGGEAKLGAIGVRVRHWVSFHGVSLNVAPDLSHYDGIVPCGIATHGVTSLQALGAAASTAAVEAALQRNWPAVFAAPDR